MAASNAKRAAVILLLASGQTASAAAAQAKVGVRSVYRWQAEESFAAEVRQARAELFARGAAVLAGGMFEAAEVLRALLKSQSETVRMAAARQVLQLAADLRRETDTEETIAELRERLDALEKRRPPREKLKVRLAK
jgi:HEAT repeat protein